MLWTKKREEAEGQPSNMSDWAGGDATSRNRLVEKMMKAGWASQSMPCAAGGSWFCQPSTWRWGGRLGVIRVLTALKPQRQCHVFVCVCVCVCVCGVKRTSQLYFIFLNVYLFIFNLFGCVGS